MVRNLNATRFTRFSRSFDDSFEKIAPVQQAILKKYQIRKRLQYIQNYEWMKDR